MIEKIIKDDEGSVIVYGAIIAPLLIGFVALGVDVTFALTRQRQIQIASDAAAYSAAMFISTNKANGNFRLFSDLRSAAENQAIALAKNMGFTKNVTASVSYDSTAREYLVSVDIFEERHFSFIDIYRRYYRESIPTTRVSAQSKAVASGSKGQDFCYLATASAADASDAQAFNVQGSTKVTSSASPPCGIAINSNESDALTKTGTSSSITVPISDSGGYVFTGNPPNFLLSYASQVADPYQLNGARDALASDYPFGTTPKDMNTYSSSNKMPDPLPPGRYKNTDKLTNNSSSSGGTVNLQSGGTYYFDDFKFTQNVTGSNVLIIVSPKAGELAQGANYQTDFKPTGTLTLSGRTSGTYAGLLFASTSPYLRNARSNPVTLGGSASSTYTGAIYFPYSDIYFYGGGSSTNNLCAQMIAQKVTLQGDAYFTDKGTSCSIFQNAGTEIERLLVRLIQ